MRQIIQNFTQLFIKEKLQLPLFIPVILGLGILYGVNFPLTSFFHITIFCSILIVISLFFNNLIKIIISIFIVGFYIIQTGGILNTELLINKQYIKEQIDEIYFHAKVNFIESSHPTMENMKRIIFKNIFFQNESNKNNLEFIKTIKMTCGSKLLMDIKPKDNVKVIGNITPFRGPAIPGSFDHLQYNTAIGVDAVGIVYCIKKSDYLNFKHNFLDNFSHMRFYLTKVITSKIKEKAGSIAAAFLTGDKTSIDPEIRENFIKTGTAHILAISGLHMNILAGILFFIFKRLFLYIGCIFPRYINASSISATITIPLLFLYLTISGFSPSAIRAFIMSTICLFSIIIGKKAISLKNISISAFVTLLFFPASLFHISFQLSFSAVLALISFYKSYQKKIYNIRITGSALNKIILYILLSIFTTIIATAATAPISIATFNRFSSQNILGNLVAIPITSFLIFPLGIVNIIIGSFTDILIKPLEISINLLISAMQIIANFPLSEIVLRTPSSIIMFMINIGGIILCLLQTKIRHIGSILIAISLYMYIFVQKNPYIIFVPEEDNLVCVIENNNLYVNSKQKGRNKVKAIMNNLGIKGEIQKLPKDFVIPKYKFDKKFGLFIWKNGDKKQISDRKHPLCPAYYKVYKELN